jgi:hypothetical protein
MKYYKYLAAVLLVSGIVLFGLYGLYKVGYKRYYSFEHERLNELINGKKYHDVLFLGSSRSFFHVNPKVVDSVAGVSSFNGGIEGGNILETNLILKCYLASHQAPKVVVIDLSTPSLNINSAPGFRPIFNPNRYYPFLDNPYVFEALKPYKHVYMLKYLPFSQITEADDVLKQAAVMGYMGKESTRPGSQVYNGYRQRSNDTLTLPFKKQHTTTNYGIEEQGVALFKETLEICKNKGIKVVVTFAPVYNANNQDLNPEFFPTVQKICAEYSVPFWSYKDNLLSRHHKLFFDEIHLNDAGTYIYSLMLGKDITNHLQGLAKQGEYDSSLLSLLDRYNNDHKEVLTSL